MEYMVRFFLVYVDPQNFYVWKMRLVPLGNNLMFEMSIYNFTATLTKSIVDSIQQNQTNPDFFNALPLQKAWCHQVSLTDAEKICVTLHREALTKYPSNYTGIISVYFPFISLRWFWVHYYSFYNHIASFVQNYAFFHAQVFSQPQQVTPQHQQITCPTIQIEERKIYQQDEVEEIEPVKMDINAISLVDDCVKMCPNNIVTYYISKYVSSYLDTKYREKEFNIVLDQANRSVCIQLCPLVDVQLLTFSINHYKNLLSMINSFDFMKDEIYQRLRQLVNQFVYLINLYIQDNSRLEMLILPLKIVELLMFIYSVKYHQYEFAQEVPSEATSATRFHTFMLNMVNYYIKFIYDAFNKSKFQFDTILLQHPVNPTFTEEIKDLSDLDQILVSERYLLTIDRESFINSVYKKAKDATQVPQGKKVVSLSLNNPSILELDLYINKNVPKSSWLSYHLIEPPKSLKDHNILTKEYFQLLQLAKTPEAGKHLLGEEIDPLLTKYSDVILNVIFKELSQLDRASVISTLNLLSHYIRPFLNGDASVDTEMRILYRCVIPYLYDIYGINRFLDYFH